MFTKASRTKKKLRMAIAGPSGSGKTYTALSLATALSAGGRVALIDTERGSASLYSDRFQFDVSELDTFSPDTYIMQINDAANAGYTVLVIDSLSHAWFAQGGVLDQVNKRGGNSFTDGWGKVGTPLQNRLMDTILTAPLHIICTMRVKTDYVVEQNEKGKSAPRRVGLKEVQREGVEYDFDILAQMDINNGMVIEKSRMADLTNQTFDKPDGKVIGARILKWLNEGEAPAAVQTDQQRWAAFCREHGFTVADIEAAIGVKQVGKWMTDRNATLDDAMNQMVAWAQNKAGLKQPAAAGGK